MWSVHGPSFSSSAGRPPAEGRVTSGGLRLVAARLAPPAFFGLVPLVVLGFAAYTAFHQHTLGLDFQRELYPEAKLLLHGRDPLASPDANLSGGANRIWPIPAALLVVPLTFLPVKVAAGVFCGLLLVALAAALRLLGITDWRIYGLVALWPPTTYALQSGNLTILLVLLAALMWRFRARRLVPGLALGFAVALKLYMWPFGIWLLARRRFAATALATAIAVAGTLLVLPFMTLDAYIRLMRNLGRTFGPQSYNLIGLLTQAHVASFATATTLADVSGAAVLALAYRRRSLSLVLAATLLLSPIVWMHYYVALIVPLALARPRLAVAWALPLVLYLCPADGGLVRAGDTVIVLALLTVVTVLGEFPVTAPSTQATALLPAFAGEPLVQAGAPATRT